MERRWLVDVDGEELTVAVEGAVARGAERRVRVGGLEATATALPDGGWLFHLPDGRVHRLDTEHRRAGMVAVMHRARPYEVHVRSEHDALLGVGGPGHGGSGHLMSSMPGKIVKVLVAVGDAVAAGDGVVILEAMKMENVVKAPVGGVVERIHVSEGTSVESDAPLVDIAAAG